MVGLTMAVCCVLGALWGPVGLGDSYLMTACGGVSGGGYNTVGAVCPGAADTGKSTLQVLVAVALAGEA